MIKGPVIDFNNATLDGFDPVWVTKILPAILREEDTQISSLVVVSLVSSFAKGKDEWLPEALMMFKTPGLSAEQKRTMIESVFRPKQTPDDATIDTIANCSATIGRYGFSFPQWRFVSQGFAGPALIERYGLQRLARHTDVGNADLPKSNPNRDHFGIGFVKSDAEWTIEYRRAYILCSHRTDEKTTTLVMRNSSRFFGRDRLPAPAYISWENLTPDDLQNLDDHDFSKDGPFIEWNDILNETNIPLPEKLRDVQNLLAHLDDEDMRLSQWLFSQDGQTHLADFMLHGISKQAEAGKTTPPFYIAAIDPTLPPWFPEHSFASTTDLADHLQSLSESPAHDFKLVLLSGPGGDFPLKSEPAKVNQTMAPPAIP